MRSHIRIAAGMYRAENNVGLFLMHGNTEIEYREIKKGEEFEVVATAREHSYALADDSESFPGECEKPVVTKL